VTDQEFWAGVWARLALGGMASDARGAVYPEDAMGGIAILGETAMVTLEDEATLNEAAIAAIRRNAVALFWQSEWRRGLDLFDLRHAFVERPIMRIDRMREIFVTSPFTILDSLTYYFESATYDLQTDRRFGAVESVYQALFSRPFEDAIENYLR